MKQSNFFYISTKELPKEEASKNAQLLIRGGFVDKLSAGVYTYLPLGFRVIKKIEKIIREELRKIGAIELLMPSLHPRENWVKTGRWDSMDDLYKITEGSKEIALGPTHEEVVVPLASRYIQSWQDIPRTEGSQFSLSLFQFQTKFRKELRAKSGILRTREFIMKDLYSFHQDEQDLDVFYKKVEKAYQNIWKRIGIVDKVYYTFAAGGTFSKFSHEYQLVTSAGEDTIYVCKECEKRCNETGHEDMPAALNKEIIEEVKSCPICGSKDFREEKAIEIGNIFKLKTKFTEPFDLRFTNDQGEKKLVTMGCYGIGLGRVMGAVAEISNDSKGVIWPKEVSPFCIHLIRIDSKDDKVAIKAESLYNELKEKGYEILYDDRIASPGKKLIDADIIGIPVRIVVSQRSLENGGVEIKLRNSEESKIINTKELYSFLKESL